MSDRCPLCNLIGINISHYRDDPVMACPACGMRQPHWCRVKPIAELQDEIARLKAELAAVKEPSIEACNPVSYSASKDDPWWMPKLVDHEFCERLRRDYPDDAHLDDEELAEQYEYTLGEYATTWDNLGDAYDQFQRLADAYFNLRSQLTQAEPRPEGDDAKPL